MFKFSLHPPAFQIPNKLAYEFQMFNFECCRRGGCGLTSFSMNGDTWKHLPIVHPRLHFTNKPVYDFGIFKWSNLMFAGGVALVENGAAEGGLQLSNFIIKVRIFEHSNSWRQDRSIKCLIEENNDVGILSKWSFKAVDKYIYIHVGLTILRMCGQGLAAF